ncbi:PREDICTED: light-regulated protein [Tarenaya hassleriana]|uniref:light-regulated protein n=1 Tax=Tarenaya hassleriana TaxID=28532 RepID=UPI00053C29B2|nr:PREDICTED: light-regulated protein [Tarenaya hassleriana]
MQTGLSMMNMSTLPVPSPLNRSSPPFFPLPSPKLDSKSTPRVFSAKAAPASSDPLTVDYSSFVSVFPAEACETIGGEACLADVYPEVKLTSEPTTPAMPASEPYDREYLEYNDPKTVFCAEACDDLGGEFCSPDYQKGVY